MQKLFNIILALLCMISLATSVYLYLDLETTKDKLQETIEINDARSYAYLEIFEAQTEINESVQDLLVKIIY